MATGSAAQTVTVGDKNNNSSLTLRSGSSGASADSLVIDQDTSSNVIFKFGNSVNTQSAKNVIFVGNFTTAPSGNPSGGGVLYAQSGAGKWKGSSGTTTTFGPAGPHCGKCGYDCWRVAQHNVAWQSWHYECANCNAVYKGGPQSVLDLLTPEQQQELLQPNMTWEQVLAVVARPSPPK